MSSQWGGFDSTLDWNYHLNTKFLAEKMFPSAYRCWDARLCSCEMGWKSIFGGITTFGDSYVNFFFFDASAGHWHNCEVPDCCYVIERGPNSSLISHLTKLLFRFDVKLFLLSIFKFVDVWSSMSCIVLIFAFADRNVFRECGLFMDGNNQS